MVILDFIKKYLISILLACSFVTLLLSFFVLIIHFRSIRKKSALLKIELSVSLQLITDALFYYYTGTVTNTALWVCRITAFIDFTLTFFNVFFLCEYITALFMETGKFEQLPKRLLLGYIIPSVGVSFIVVSQFTGMLYSINAANEYVRGPLFFLGSMFPFGTIIMLFTFVMQYRKLINKRLLWSIIIFSSFPLICGFVQFYVTNIPLVDLVSWECAVTLFWFALSDQNDELMAAANSDAQTHLPNSFGYLYELERVVHFQNVLEYDGYYFDIVRMSHINNKYGKELGDDIICIYAAAIKKTLEKDEILGRLGGNFFVALIKKTNRGKFLKLLSDVPVTINFNEKKETLHIAAVAGIYEIRSRSIAAGQILSNSATAATYAKNVAHKPYVLLNEALEAELKRQQLLEDSARKGLPKGEFLPYYQPKVNLTNNELCGAEALVRWQKDGKLIPPVEFIPIMEKNNSICDLDFYILNRVCQDIQNWLKNGIKPVTVSVNFSRRNLGNPVLAEEISKTVEKYNIPKSLIQIEITETLDEYPLSYLVGVVEALQRYGLTVAIDDFGTGSSSINLLKVARFDQLKIDKSFIDYTNEKEKQLLRDIISMAKNLGISVIAEGVEEESQVMVLKDMGCFQIQGYYFDKPLPIKDYEERLKQVKY